ncbi:DUF6625 family protein [Streptococcus hillyeri]|uniref:DUF6625 family protein n=1 Tax=Streptococcus hillyeri TaxID=2282420 RepID=UPI0034E1BFFF
MVVKKKRIFIIAHFGKFNNYFQLFLNSCNKNQSTNFLILTDDKTKYIYPRNVKVIYSTLGEINQRAEKVLKQPIQIQRPYKLCDLKSIYGLLFSDLITEYDYWGYCDTDLIFGNFDKLIEPVLGEEYDKIFFLGHCSLVKNTQEINRLLLSEESFVNKLSDSENNYSLDEEFSESINTILLKYGKKIYLEELEANTYTKTSNFYLTHWNHELKKYEIIKNKNHLFVYENGSIYEYFLQDNQLYQKEYLYMHFQSRPMEIKINLDTQYYKIIPNAFEELEYSEVTLENFGDIKKKNFNLHYFKLRSKNLMIKLKRKIRGRW